jgi:hypothetical protein
MPRLSTDGAEARAAKLKADATLMFDKKSEPTPVPEFVARRNAVETSDLEARIADLRRGEHS